MTGIVAGLILLCILVVVHELGHFLFAKVLGVRVLTFSVGFGPKLFSFKRNETEYRFSAILLGGYVKMYGESFTDEVSQDEKKYSFMHQPIWKKSLIAFAGPLFNFILPIILFFFMFIGSETTMSPVVGTVLPNQAAALAGLKAGDKIVALDGKKVETFAELVEQVSSKPGQSVLLDIERKGENEAIVNSRLSVIPEAEINTHPLYQGEFIGRIGVMPAVQKPQIAVIHPGSVASKAGLLSFDEVLTVNKVPVLSAADLLEKISTSPGENLALVVKRTLSDGSESVLPILLPSRSQKPLSYQVNKAMKRFAVTEDELVDASFKKQIELSSAVIGEVEKLDWQHRGIAFIDGTLAGVEDDSAASELGLQKNDRVVAVDGVTVSSWVEVYQIFEKSPDDHHVASVLRGNTAFIVAFRLKEQAAAKSSFGPPPSKVFGQKIAQAYQEGPTFVRSVGVIEAFTRAVERTWDLIAMTVKSLWMLITFQVPVSQLGGPIMLFGVAGQAAEQGMAFYIYVMSLISVNLGLLNLLPVPVLDGGHLLMFGIEAVQRKPISLKTRQIATQIGLIFVLLLTVIALFNDFSRLIN